MKVTDKKFLNVHQTIGPMTLGSVNVTSSSNSIVKDGTNGSSASAASGKADKLLVIGEKKRNLKLPALEHAALTQVCLGILNLDQSLTRE